MRITWGRKGYVPIVATATLLCALCLLAASCGGRGTGGTAEPIAGGNGVKVDGQGDVDALLEDLDGIMNSVDAEDFSQNRLGDAELGL